MPQFSSHESVSLEKEVELKGQLIESNVTEIDKLYEVQRCAEWIRQNKFQNVCLQFPDHLLPDSSEVALKLQNILGQTVYILGDTAYESCCIDYVAAAHIDADAIIHFGPTCFSKTSGNVPYLNIYEKHCINVADLQAAVAKSLGDLKENLVMLLDDAYIHCYDIACKVFEDWEPLQICKIDEDLPNLSDRNLIFIGSNSRKIMNINLNFKAKKLYYFDPNKTPPDIIEYKLDARILKRRYFLMEKIRDANTIGIVIGTLAIQNYLKVIERVKKLAALNGKKYYLISVGKPTVAKLANLGEIDVYVMITCSMNEIFDTRDFYKPVVTPYDVEIALNPDTNNIQFTYDYNCYLDVMEYVSNLKRPENETDVSLLTGRLRSNIPEMDTNRVNSQKEPNSQIAIKSDNTVALNSNFGAGFLSERTWKGLEQNLGQTEVKLAEEGRSGIAQGYQNEQF